MRSLFLFDMTFWLYLAALGLYVAYLFAKRPAMQMAPAGIPLRTWKTVTGLGRPNWDRWPPWSPCLGGCSHMALMTQAFERMEHSGTLPLVQSI